MMKLFNPWRTYPKHKPKEDGFYYCTVQADEVSWPCIRLLYYQSWNDSWINYSRQTVFDGYKVYKPGKEPLEYNRVHKDGLSVRGDVIAFKRCGKPYIPKELRKTNHK